MTGDEIAALVASERQRQRAKWDRKHPWGYGDCSSDGVAAPVKAMVLAEECGEVCRAVLDLDDDHLRLELVQVAAVAWAWLESLPARAVGPS